MKRNSKKKLRSKYFFFISIVLCVQCADLSRKEKKRREIVHKEKESKKKRKLNKYKREINVKF